MTQYVAGRYIEATISINHDGTLGTRNIWFRFAGWDVRQWNEDRIASLKFLEKTALFVVGLISNCDYSSALIDEFPDLEKMADFIHHWRLT